MAKQPTSTRGDRAKGPVARLDPAQRGRQTQNALPARAPRENTARPASGVSRVILDAIRPDDLLVLGIELCSLVQRGTPPHLTPTGAGDAFIVLHFPPQNIAEEAFFESAAATGFPLPPEDPDYDKQKKRDPPSETPPSAGLPVKARIADGSRIAFKVPPGKQIKYSLQGILEACQGLEMSVAPTALSRQVRLLIPFPLPILGAVKAKLPLSQSLQLVSAHVRNLKLATSTSSGALASLALRLEAVAPGLSKAVAPSLPRPPGTPAAPVPVREPPPLAPPGLTHTALELPYRLILSPNCYGRWLHSPVPVKSKEGYVELWHSRLGTEIEREVLGLTGTRTTSKEITEDPNDLKTLRAVWARPEPATSDGNPKNHPPHANDPFRMSLDDFDRFDIVHLSSNYKLRNYSTSPIECERLMLSALGAWLESRGTWNPPSPFAVEEWAHRATMGRDHYVRVVYAGYLLPFGHSASLVKVTERKFHNKPGNPAYLRQRMYIVVKERDRFFTRADLIGGDGRYYHRQFPFSRVRITTIVTPDLDDARTPPAVIGSFGQSLFWPCVGNEPFRFHMVATDLDGRDVEFTLPLMFIDNTKYLEPAAVAKAFEAYMARGAWRIAALEGQRVALAPSANPGDTSVEAVRVEFAAETENLTAYVRQEDRPAIYPKIETAEARIGPIAHLTENTSPSTIKWFDGYLKSGFDSNPGQVFLSVTAGPDLDFTRQGDRSGGFLTPNLRTIGLSRLTGPVSGTLASGPRELAAYAAGVFTPTDFFKQVSPKLFGCISLAEVITGVTANLHLDLTKIPRFRSESASRFESLISDLGRAQEFAELVEQLTRNQTDTASNNLYEKALLLVDGTATDLNALKPMLDPATIEKFVADPAGQLVPALQGLENKLRDFRNALTAVPLLDGAQKQSALALLDSLFEAVTKVSQLIESLSGEELTVRFDWNPEIKSCPANDTIFRPNDPRGLAVAVEARVKKAGNATPRVSVFCSLKDFDLVLVGTEHPFLTLEFQRIAFEASPGRKVNVDVVLDRIAFGDCLEFVETLRDLIPLDGFSDPPYLDVSASEVKAGFSTALPSIAVGMFSLQNLSLGAVVTVPFIGDPLSVRFDFCTREQPFLLTVSMFGGGGYFGMTVTPAGMEVEAAFEFGACISLNIGVASGSVRVMGGIQFYMAAGAVQLGGYFHLCGQVDVLGLVSASLDLCMDLIYDSDSHKVIGSADLTIEIEVFLFSGSVTIHCERKFAGSNGDPSFAQLMGPAEGVPLTDQLIYPWREYCAAFA